MARLVIKQFSCIEKADVELANLTIIIGEQASGKSLVSKLIYFFQEILVNHGGYIGQEKDIEDIKKEILDRFKILFPQSAWGKKKFFLFFEMNEFTVKIERLSVAKTKLDALSISFSDFFIKEYDLFLNIFKEALKNEKYKAKSDELEQFSKSIIFRSIRNFARKDFLKVFGGDVFESQIFIPAGRAFFTSIGKMVAVFEYSNKIDSITTEFGRLQAFLSDEGLSLYSINNIKAASYQNNIQKKLLGGVEGTGKERGFLLANDGRKIPLAFTSSGQQELLPLLKVLDYLGGIKKPPKPFLFIEEPEAHLFPSAQSLLIEYISSFVVDEKKPSRIFITTHSPYILAQVNNFLKAGMLTEEVNDSTKSKIDKIVCKEAWLKKGSTVAYAIKDGEVLSIMDDDGLIDAEAIDGISADISEQFSKLLDIEYPDA